MSHFAKMSTNLQGCWTTERKLQQSNRSNEADMDSGNLHGVTGHGAAWGRGDRANTRSPCSQQMTEGEIGKPVQKLGPRGKDKSKSLAFEEPWCLFHNAERTKY